MVPTIFGEDGALDPEGRKRCIDFMIDAGSDGLCILANFSEQFVLTDTEREQVMRLALEHVAGRVPVIVTTTHFGTRVCAGRSRRAQDMGAAMVMVMPPYHGATVRVGEPGIELGGDTVEGPWDGEEAITLLPDMDARATGAMTGGGYPDGFRQIVDVRLTGDRAGAVAAYGRW